ncbi:glycerophosphodiester phosphodiesterase domain-containing protein 5-like isoform X2 [Amphiura filiformis]|uniref:glycerophosphodiester phosphodiesterase domain-containing protein 5-like isoform X2 n=1 Tax=Amphiura filiformis TaxID=82378 RepID=UPI003B224C85
MVSHVRLENQQNYRQQVCLSCMTGLYGCRWKRYRRSTEPTTVIEKTFLLITIIAFAFMAMWLYYWIIAENSADDFNWFMWTTTNSWFHWFTLVFTLTIIAFIYTTFLVLLAIAHCITGQQLHLYIVHKVTIIILLCACIAFCITLTELWPEEWDLLFISLQVTAPILQIMGVVILTFLTWPLAGIWWKSTSSTAFRWVTFIAYSCLLLFVYLCPLAFLTPCMLGHNSLPKRPLIMTHKGAPMLAPENTELSFQKAASYNIYGFESDVRISLDGIPFLMHDSTLERTTNVHKVFPNRTKHSAEFFTFEELQQLDAGSWFLQKNPFYTAKRMSKAEKQQIKNQTIPSLTKLMQVAKHYNNKSVIFDLFMPPSGHPYRGNFTEQTVSSIKASGIQEHQIWWLSDFKRDWVLKNAPDFEQTATTSMAPKDFKRFQIVHMNAEYSQVTDQDIQDFKKINISTNIYTVNKPWLYSLYWCIGVKSVTSGACQVLQSVEAPIWHTTPQIWRIIWILEDCVSLICVVLIFVFQRYRFPRRPSNPEAISLHTNRTFPHNHGKKSDRELLYRSNEDTPMPAPAGDASINHRPHNGYEDIPSPDGTSSPTDSLPDPQHEEIRMTLE